MKRPLKKQFCKPFSLDSKFVCFDSKEYAKVLSKYADYLEDINAELLKACKKMKEELPRAVSIGGDKKYMKLLDAWQDITQAIKKATE